MKAKIYALLAALATISLGTAAENTPKIAWWPTLEQAREEAARTGKPIFLVSAAPHCKNVSGMW